MARLQTLIKSIDRSAEKSVTGKALKNAGMRFLDTVLPPRCVMTGERVERQGMITPSAWLGLDFISAPHCACCGLPFSFTVEDGSLCTDCLDTPPPFQSARAPLTYNDASRSLILGFKHADKTHSVRAFVPWLMQAGKEMLAQADILVPVPLHRKRLLARRYNQAGLMAQTIAKVSGHTVLLDGVTRTRATVSQGHLSTDERSKNVRKAFDVHPRYVRIIDGKVIVLVDDVYTTGATVRECTRALLKSSAKAVHVLTLARVVRGEN